MHTEHNAWLNALDVIYHEALQRGSVKQFLTVLEGPQNEPKLMPAGQPRTQGCLSTTLVQGENVLHFDWLIKKQLCQVENTRKPRDNHCEDEI